MKVAVVGAGWSGLAAAVALVQADCSVTVFDAAPTVGGRARRVVLELAGAELPLDNGQHLLIGAYRAIEQLMRTVGVDPDAAFLRQPFALVYPDGVALRAARAPAPFHLAAALLSARGLPWSARLALATTVARLRRRAWKADHPAQSAASLLAGQPPVLLERLWEPLCLAALNVRLTDASAQILLHVLRDSLGADAAASDFLLPRCDLSALLPEPAARWLIDRGAALSLRTPVDALRAPASAQAPWTLAHRNAITSADAVVLAVPPARAAALLPATVPAACDATTRLAVIETAPISTVYLRYAHEPALPHPVTALREDLARGHYGQWVFDRGAADRALAGVLSVIVSGRGSHQALTQAALGQAVQQQLADSLQLPAPLGLRVVSEKTATLMPAPALERPATRLVKGLYLAADSAHSDYPSTLEGSVRAGQAAARALLADFAVRPAAA